MLSIYYYCPTVTKIGTCLTDCSKMYQQQVWRTYNCWFFWCYICRERQSQWS